MTTPDPPTCAACAEPLVLLVHPSSSSSSSGDDDAEDAPMADSSNTGTYIPDDVHLQCGCHFHWQCLLDNYTLSTCPSCSHPLITTTNTTNMAITRQEHLLCTLHNEGGVQHDIDILPLLTEESYLETFPEERFAHAFLAFCAEGDVDAIIDLLCSPATPSYPEIDIPRYQHPTSLSSGLHLAIAHNHQDVAWLLLLLASSLDPAALPDEVVRAAETMGLEREDPGERVDVRALWDGEGKTAEERAGEVGGVWREWVRRGWLRPPTTMEG